MTTPTVGPAGNARVESTRLDRSSLRIERIETIALRAPLARRFVGSAYSMINRTTIITTNFEDRPAAGVGGTMSAVRAAARDENLGDRIGERMRSRLHEMCRIIKLDGLDFRQKFRSANFR